MLSRNAQHFSFDNFYIKMLRLNVSVFTVEA